MRASLFPVFVFLLFMSFSAPAGADFQLVRKIPVPVMACEADDPVVRAMGTDGDLLCLTRGCYIDLTAMVYRIDPDDGDIVNYDEWNYEIPECVETTMPVSMAHSPYDGMYYVGTDCGAVVALYWMAEDSAWAVNTFSFGDSLMLPSGMAPGQYSTLFASDREDLDLVEFEGIGMFYGDEPMTGVDDPVGMATYEGHLFVLDAAGARIIEMDTEAVNVAVHYVEDWTPAPGGLNGSFEPEAATFMGEHLYLAGNDDSIHVYELVESVNYTEPVPEGDSVEVVVIPEELVITFESVTDSGDVTVDVLEDDDCPPPSGVTLFPEYYDIATDATFEYITEVAILDSVYPGGVDRDLVRVFSRRSDACFIWRDITVAPLEDIPVLKILTRSKSEDDEFSIFALGEDTRTPQEVVEFKLADLRGHIESAEDSMPVAAYNSLLGMLEDAEDDYYMGESGSAAEDVSGMEEVVKDNPGIPHTYDPDDPGRNVAGRIIGRAHTLEFSLLFSEGTRYFSSAEALPEDIHVGIRFEWFRMFLEVPEELDAAEVDVDHIYLQSRVRAVPESVMVFDYDTDGEPEIRVLFPGGQAQTALAGGGCGSIARASCFVGGFELHSLAGVDVTEPVVRVGGDGLLLSGTEAAVSWERFGCGESPCYTLSFSPDGGEHWEPVAVDISERRYDWVVPDTPTDVALIRVMCGAESGEPVVMYSGLFEVASGAGIDEEREPDPGFKLALRPNPASGAVEVEFTSPVTQVASVAVYSVRGELVATLLEGPVAAGSNRITWDGRNRSGGALAAGAYFVVLRAETGTLTQKVVIQR